MNPTPNAPDDSRAEPGQSIPDDPRLIEAVREYQHELESGRQPDRRAWLDRYSDLADALGACLDGLELLYRGMTPGPRPQEPADAYAGSPLGDFRIVREIGRGGMGIVYEATQLSLGRRVALKVLPLAATFDARHLQRFHQEARAAAQLHHTNIVPVHAVGCDRGIHFYAMQLIEGQSLEAIIRQLRQQSGLSPVATLNDAGSNTASGALSPAVLLGLSGPSSLDVTRTWPGTVPASPDREAAQCEETLRRSCEHFSTQATGANRDFYRAAARTMAAAAEALEYAHQQGIIHRDIKPANLLIDVRSNVWITDFGLAHFHSDPGLTATGDVLGTVRYMSPEQASGQRVILDHRTDVYSLAATFYELVTLRPVFAGGTRHGLLFDVLNREPRPPRSIDRRIPPEFETILLKSLNKNPADRYASAQDLADDLHRFLRDEPIRARRPSALEHVRKWSRRHPALIGAGVLAMFLTLIVSLVSNWLVGRANERTRAALSQELLRAEEAQQRYRQARQAVDLLIEVSEEELGNKPPMQGLRKRLLETALVYYQDFIAQHRDDPASQASLIAVEQRIKKILDDLSVIEGAGLLLLLGDRRVQDDLALDDSQRGRIDAISTKFTEIRSDSLRDFDRLTAAQRRARFMDLARANDQSTRTILTPAQSKRVEQIVLQLQWLMALGRPEIVARLGLTAAQRRTIGQIDAEAMTSMWDHMNSDESRAAQDAARRSTMHEAMDKAMAVLTPDQRTRWKEIVGAPFAAAADLPPHTLLPPP